MLGVMFSFYGWWLCGDLMLYYGGCKVFVDEGDLDVSVVICW